MDTEKYSNIMIFEIDYTKFISLKGLEEYRLGKNLTNADFMKTLLTTYKTHNKISQEGGLNAKVGQKKEV